MFQTKRSSAFRVLLMLAFFMSIVTLLLPLSVLADGSDTIPPIQNPDPILSPGGDALTTVVVTLLTVLMLMP